MVKTIIYNGRIPSHNDIYGTKNWRSRYSASQKYHQLFLTLFKQDKLPKYKHQFCIDIYFNSRHDVDNIVGIEKYFTDSLVRGGYVVGDDSKYFKKLTINYDGSLAKNTVKFVITFYKDDNN